jgi:CPA2 family monovalent cation:H+ antiporter-2
LYGDATRQQVLLRAGILSARALVLSIPDPASSRQILVMAKKMNPSLHVMVRIRYLGQVSDLDRLGADQVVADEFESSLAMTGRLMEMYKMDQSDVDEEMEVIRHQGFRLLWEDHPKK